MSFRSAVFVAALALAAAPSCREEASVTTKTEPAAAPPAAEPSHRAFADEALALETLMDEQRPLAVGFGEFHQTLETTDVRSTISRFRESLLPVLAARASDLVVETWVSEGGCGAAEAAVVSGVEEVSRRPAQTEDETRALLARAKALGVRPAILEMRCADYARVHQPDGGLDYVAMLELVAQRLGARAAELLAKRDGANADKSVLIYGGAIHNDLSPSEDWASFAFGRRLFEATGGRYIEVDLYVPELVEASRSAREEPWYPLVTRLASTDRAHLIEWAPGSWIMVFRRGAASRSIPTG